MKKQQADNRIFTFEIKLLGGIMTEEFMNANRKVTRTVELKANQTLDHLHKIIFKAFDRYDPHLYEFQIGGKNPMDRAAYKYVLPEILEDIGPFAAFGDMPPKENLKKAVIGKLPIAEKQRFFYWFDYGDDWWHEVKLKSIKAEPEAGAKYPRIIGRVGESPPQYIEWE